MQPPDGADRPDPTRRRRLGGLDPTFLVSAATVFALFLGLGHFFPGLIGTPRPAAQPALTRVPDTGTIGPHAFMATTPHGRPVGYDPCQPIHYVVNPAGGPSDGTTLIQDAVRQVEAASGMTFVDDGLTQEPPNPRRPPSEPGRYHQRWAPVLIAWADHAHYPEVGGDIEGVGGSTSIRPTGPESARFVTGEVVLNRDGMATILAGEDGYVLARAVVMHELGHVVGLDHVNDPGELMAPRLTGLIGFGPGDRQGFVELRADPCWPTD